jgi:hypothetical protein
MGRKYLEALEASLADNLHSYAGNTAPAHSSPTRDKESQGPNIPARKNRKNRPADTQGPKDGTSKNRKNNKTESLGLIASWSHEFGYVSLHDPTAGEWHDVAVKDAPAWALSEARKRKELYKAGDYRAYRLTSRQMEEIWQADQQVTEEEGIVEEYPLEEDYE